jgi:folate-dependent phosphoribosylglycinamide formyltransferase PurN
MQRKWIAFFTMSGSEIYNVSHRLRRMPDLVVTNRTTLEGVNEKLLEKLSPDQLLMVPNKPTAEEYFTAIAETGSSDVLITLHGYLRIVPRIVCDTYEIINCHPGLITQYPELKGKDPQARSINYPTIGTVLHRVTAGVDEGPVLMNASCDNVYFNETTITHKLKQMSENLWIELLRKQFRL